MWINFNHNKYKNLKEKLIMKEYTSTKEIVNIVKEFQIFFE